MLSRLVVNALLIMKNMYLAHDSYVEQYAKDDDFRDVYEALTKDICNEGIDYNMHNNLLYHLGKLCISMDERVNVIQKAHTSLISGHFRLNKMIAQLQRYLYWPRINDTVSKYIKGCVLCSTSKPGNRKMGLYTPLLGTFTTLGKYFYGFYWRFSFIQNMS